MPIGTYSDYTPAGAGRVYKIPVGASPSHGPENFQYFADQLENSFASEPVADCTIVTNVLTFNLIAANVGYVATAPTANFTVNVTNAPTTNGRAISISLMVVQGATGYIPNALQIAGVAQTIKWLGGTAPTPTSTAGKIDVFSFTLIRRGSAWEVLGSSMLKF